MDNGSDTTICLNSLAESLGVSGKPVHFSLSSIDAENSPKSGYEVALNVLALDGDDTILLDKVWTVDRLPISKRSVPSDEDVSQWPHLKDVKFPRLDGEKPVSTLIGNDVPEAHWVYEERCGGRKQPYTVRTPLGWTLIGHLNSHRKNWLFPKEFMLGSPWHQLRSNLGPHWVLKNSQSKIYFG